MMRWMPAPPRGGKADFSPAWKFCVCLALFLASSGLDGQIPPPEVPDFRDISQAAGLTVPHISTAENMLELMSGGVGFLDCDNDGKLDILTVNGSTADRFRAGGDPMVTLYHQENGLRFRNITAEAGLTRKGWGMGIAVADFDNDGWQDIYVTGFGGSVLYRNKGNCQFEDVTAQAGVAVGGFPSGAAWGDYDRDGQVDLFVPRYVHVDTSPTRTISNGRNCTFLGLRVYCGPWGFPGESDFLFRNRGDGTFEDVSKKAGVADDRHLFGMQGIWADLENNGWPDLYVTNDRGPNYLYRNKHDGTFEETGILDGVADSADGREQGSMGVDAGDFLHDGRFSLFVTNFQQDSDTLYLNRGTRGFDDISTASGIAPATFSLVGWGTGFADLTNSGWLDIVVANGHIYPQIDEAHLGFTYKEPLLLLHNNRDGTFRDITQLSMLARLPLKSRRGVALGDINNDGRLDILILNVGEPPTLLLNCTRNAGHAVLLKLIGRKSNRAAIGARVTLTAGGLRQIEEVRGGGSYVSQNDLRLHFGLGGNTHITTVGIRWPSGTTETLRGLPADSIYTIEEGRGIQTAKPFDKPAVCGGGN